MSMLVFGYRIKVFFWDCLLNKLFLFRLIPLTFLTAGYKILVSDDINILPSVMISYVQPLPIGFDVNAKIQYQDLLWLGFSYRYHQGYAAMLGVNISGTINLGYSYDYTTTQLNTVSSGTHEIVLGFLWRRNNNKGSHPK